MCLCIRLPVDHMFVRSGENPDEAAGVCLLSFNFKLRQDEKAVKSGLQLLCGFQ